MDYIPDDERPDLRHAHMTDEPTTIYRDEDLIETSPAVDKLFEALAAAQAEMSDPAKTKTAKVKTKAGPEYSYKYSDLADLLQITRPILGKNGLCLLQLPVNPRPGSVRIVNRLGHKSGQWIQWVLTMPVGDEKPQTMGSMITYGRRYAAAGAASIAPDEDDDGNVGQDAAGDPRGRPRGSGQPPPRQQQQARPPQTIPPETVYDPTIIAHKQIVVKLFPTFGLKSEASWRDCSKWLGEQKVPFKNIEHAIRHWSTATNNGTSEYNPGDIPPNE